MVSGAEAAPLEAVEGIHCTLPGPEMYFDAVSHSDYGRLGAAVAGNVCIVCLCCITLLVLFPMAIHF